MELVSVVVCTYNRSRSLADTLESLVALRTDGTFEFEVVVVDNNSRDDTKGTAERFLPRFGGRLRYVFEGRQGLSHARNTGLAHARGAILAFTDDDVRPEPDWLVALIRAFRAQRADCVYGKILPAWEGTRPRWLGDYFTGRLALLDRGDTPFVVADERQELYGANFAVTKAALETAGGFNPALGRTGEQLGGGEDVDCFLKLFRAGRRIVYEPAAVVHHRIQRERMTVPYFRRWHFEHGASSASVTQPERGRGVLGIPFWALRDVGRHLGGYLMALVACRSERRLEHEMKLMFYLGLFSRKLWPSRSRVL